MDPITLVLLALGLASGIFLARRKLKKSHMEKYGEIESHAHIDSSSLPAGNLVSPGDHCDTERPESPVPGRPFTGDKPVPGKASAGTYQFMYLVQKDETPGSIAQAVTGDSRRYVELLSANSNRRMATYKKIEKLSSGTTRTRTEVNFAQGEFCEHARLYVPKSWNPWIDEAGNLRGETKPFPPYDSLPGYPLPDPTGISSGFVPWPPEKPTGWGSIPMAPIPALGGL